MTHVRLRDLVKGYAQLPQGELLTPVAKGSKMSSADDELPEYWHKGRANHGLQLGSKTGKFRDQVEKDEPPSKQEFTPLRPQAGTEYLAYGAAADVWKVTETVPHTAADLSVGGSGPPRTFHFPTVTPNQTFVCKVLRVSSLSHELAASGSKFHNELWQIFLEEYHSKVELWKTLAHKNIVPVTGVGDGLNLKVEHCEKGSVREFLQRKQEGGPKKTRIITDVLEGLHYMHTRDPPVVHGNLNAGKLFINANGTTKIGEFGLAALCYPIAPFVPAVSLSGLSRWLSPEILGDDDSDSDDDTLAPPTTASDIWALGCALYEIIAECLPYLNCKYDIRVQQSILSGQHPGELGPRFEEEPFGDIWPILVKCWSMQPANRPSALDVLTRVGPIIQDAVAARSQRYLRSRLTGKTTGAVAGGSKIRTTTENSDPVYQTRFTSRVGAYEFREPTPTDGWASLVDRWHKNLYQQQGIEYRYERLGLDHSPTWEATPIIMGELHPQYAGTGLTMSQARNGSAEKIARSGYC